jgi:mitochondrial fusion and transport protein UGO1
MNPPSSLRDLYIDPAQAWSFVPPVPAATVKVASEPLLGGPDPPVHQWSMRPSPNSIFDLSPSLDLSEPSGINATQLFKAVVASAILRYTSTAIVMPWEVGKMLLQVQWVPRDAGEPEPLESDAVENDHDDAVCLFISNAEKGWILRLRV